MKHHRQLWKTTKEHGKRRQNSGKPLLIASLLVGLLALPLGTAQATTITVDGNCTLPNAIIAANTNTISGGCPAGEGNETDTIVLNEDVTLTFIDDTVDIANYGPNGLPVVTSDIIIEGNGHIIQRGTSPLCPGYDLLSDFRIFVVTSDADLTLQDTTVRYGCSAFGGGINNGGALTLIDTTITENTATNHGGGLYNFGTLTLINTTVAQNMATNHGGGLFNHSGTADLTNTTFTGNTAYSYGGGISSFHGTVTLTNTTLAQNTATYSGGGIYIDQALATLANVTLVENSTDWIGGGIGESDSGLFILQHTLLANPNGGNCAVDGLGNASGYNLSTDFSCPLFNMSQGGVADPKLGPLVNNGGPTKTIALFSGSPAINAGDPNGCTDAQGNPLATDQRGLPRPVGSRCDIGAFERQSKQLTALKSAKVWIGLQNNADSGIKFDLKAEVYKDATLIGTGMLTSVPSGGSGFNNAVLRTISLNLLSKKPITLAPGDTLSFTLSVSNACRGSGKKFGTAQLWYNDAQADSSFSVNLDSDGKKLKNVATREYLWSGFALKTMPGLLKLSLDTPVGLPCGSFTPFGTWSVTE